MIVKKEQKGKKNLVLGSVAGILFLGTVVALYIVNKPADVKTVSADQLIPAKTIKTTFQVELFEDQRFKELKLYGPEEIEVGLRGRKADPFNPF